MSLLSIIIGITVVFRSSPVHAMSFNLAVSQVEAAMMSVDNWTKNNSTGGYCYSTTYLFSLSDANNKKVWVVNGVSILGQEAWKDGWPVWVCIPPVGQGGVDWGVKPASGVLWFCIVSPNSDQGTSKNRYQAICNEDRAIQASQFNGWLVNVGLSSGDDLPPTTSTDSYTHKTSYIEAAQKSNNGDAECIDTFIQTHGRVYCRNKAKDWYWICTISHTLSNTLEPYEVSCDVAGGQDHPYDYPHDLGPGFDDGSVKLCRNVVGKPLSWLVCPAGDLLSQIIDWFLKTIQDALRWEYLLLDGQPGWRSSDDDPGVT